MDEPRYPRRLDINEDSPSRNDVSVNSRFTLKATGAEADAYDFKAARRRAKTINLIEAIGHMIKSCLGSGIVAIHEAYMQCGLWTALVFNVLLGFAVGYCMHRLAKSAQRTYGRVKVPMMSYPDLAEACLVAGPWDKLRRYGKVFRYTVDIIIAIDLFGSCCVYQVVIARSIKQLVEGTSDYNDEGNPPIRIYIVMLIIPCILICMITTLKYLAPFSIVADIFLVTVAISTIYYGIENAEKSPTEFPAYKSVAGLFDFIGICVFSLGGVGATLPIENNMTDPKQISMVIVAGMSIVVVMIMIVGFFGYWGFGEHAQSPITINFPMSPFPITLKVLMVIIIWVTFALNFWIPFNLVWVYIASRHDSEFHWLWQRIYRAIFVTIITAMAICFPDVSNFMAVLGAFCLSNLGFIFPAIIELSLDWIEPGLGYMKWRLIKAITFILFGILLCILGTYPSIREMSKTVFITDKTSLTWSSIN